MRKSNIGKRNRMELMFRSLSLSAIIVAAAFLIFFITDIIHQGYKAFQQTEIQVMVHYSQDSIDYPESSVADEYFNLVSRGFLRMIPEQMKKDKSLMGHNKVVWVLATAELDQYMKGNVNKLTDDDIAVVKKLKKEGRIKMAFNSGFFLNGDSKLPEMAGISSAMIGSIYVMILTMFFSIPIGVMTAIYLEEFASDNWITRIIEVNINNLAAIPSILFGLLGLAIFINIFGVPRSSALAGGLTLSLMTLPVIIISTRTALSSVPDTIRQAAQGVGASPWQVVWHHTLPLSLPGIMTGAIIGLARAMGETAPLLIIGMLAYIPTAPTGVTQAATVLPAQIYTWSSDSMRAYTERTALGIIVLLAVLLLLNAAAVMLRNRYERKW